MVFILNITNMTHKKKKKKKNLIHEKLEFQSIL